LQGNAAQNIADGHLQLSAALMVMANSGRFVTTASKIRPPKASPKPNRAASISVVLAR
jgi:hypothetical protein